MQEIVPQHPSDWLIRNKTLKGALERLWHIISSGDALNYNACCTLAADSYPFNAKVLTRFEELFKRFALMIFKSWVSEVLVEYENRSGQDLRTERIEYRFCRAI